MRFEAVKCMTRSYRPSLPVSFIARTLGFSGIVSLGGEEKEIDGVDECDEWLRSHGAQINFDSNANEVVLDTKVKRFPTSFVFFSIFWLFEFPISMSFTVF